MKYLQRNFNAEYESICRTLITLDSHFEKASRASVLTEALIPKKIHFIWIGPHRFKENHLKNIESWHHHNPDYEVVLWTDRQRYLPLNFITFADIHTLDLRLKKRGEESLSYGEKADLLRYEIIEQFGGIYADVDVECHRSFNALVHKYTFFAGIEDITSMLRGNHLRVANALFGASPHHPILQKTIELVEQNWQDTTKALCRLSSKWEPDDYVKFVSPFVRSNLPFSTCVLRSSLDERTLILPPDFLGLSFHKGSPGFYSTHHLDGTWIPKNTFLKSTSQAQNLLNLSTIYGHFIREISSYSFQMLMLGVCNLAVSLFVFYAANAIIRSRKREGL